MKYLIYLIVPMFIFGYEISVSILPQKFIVENITKEKAQINVLVPKGASPAIYSPTPKQLINLKKSKLYFYIKVPFENVWLKKFKSVNNSLKFVDMGFYVKRFSSKEGIDPHIWMSPLNLILMAKEVLNQVILIDNKNKNFYIKNYEEFVRKILDLEFYIEKLNLKNKKFIVFHPSFGYFAKFYGLNQIALERGGKEASFKYLYKVIKLAKKENIKYVIVSPEFSDKSARFLANKIDAKIIKISPLEENVLLNIRHLAKVLSD